MAGAADVKSLCDFLAESELQQYYNAIKNELKITTVAHLKYASDEDLKQIGLSRPEVRRLRKFYDRYYPNGYLGKIKRLLQTPKPADMFHTSTSWQNSDNYTNKVLVDESCKAPPSNKHIIPADSITINKQLGVGEFGIVQQGVWTINGNERLQVAIKCLSRMQSNPIEFLKEAAIMHAIEHENIVRFYGVVLDTDSLMLVTELAPLRSLLECLKDSGLKVSFLTVPTLCEFAMQICNGMTYLENKRLIHRDLAARNILVFNKDKVKISDFGLSRSLGVGKDYYQTNFNVNLKLPIAWCAPECINFLRFTNSSDVWAYGVCLWEMFSYGFQPWAALTGHQILEAIDEPNFQRLDPPDCCPKEYYALMLKCWQHDPLKRPRFVDIYALLPDLRPEQVKTIAAQENAKKDHLLYRQNEIVTVLDKDNHSPLWRGVLNSGKTGFFNPANTVTYLSNVMLPSMNNPFTRTFERGSKRRLRSEMISKPQNDLKHTGHIGIDGAFFGDISFLTSPSTPPACSSIVPRQVVTPYKPSEDIEQTPLLTPTSPDSVQTNGSYFPSGAGGAFQQHSDGTSFVSRFDFTNPFQQLGGGKSNGGGTFEGENGGGTLGRSVGVGTHSQPLGEASDAGGKHEYHEISDEEVMAPDLGLSLADEMEQMFQSMSTTSPGGGAGATAASYEHTNKVNEVAEMKGAAAAAKLNLPLNCSSLYKTKKKASAGTVKPLSIKDDKILSHAIEIANEISARSMNDLVQEPATSSAQSPRRKFSFKFPLGHGHTGAGGSGGIGHDQSRSLDESGFHQDGDSGGGGHGGFSNKFGASGRHFSDELKNVTDIQESLTDQHRLAYNSLVEKPSTGAVFKQQLNDMEKSYRNGETARQAAALHTLPRASPGPGSSTSDGERATHKPPNLNISESARNGTSAHHIQQQRTKSKESIAEGVCESPSYLTSGSTYSYNAMDVAGGLVASTPLPAVSATNLVPLPPRDRFKPQTLPSQKRHVRKHALIIPATGTLRSTLDKLGSNHLSEENRLRLKTVADKSKMDLHSDTNLNFNSESKINFSALHKLQVVESAPQSPCHLIYQNFSMIPEVAMPNAADTASLNFETIVERKDLNHVPDLFSLRDCGGNGHLLERSASLVAASDCDRVDGVVVQSETGSAGGPKEADGGVVVTGAANEGAVLSNSVSCEDLLEFSEKKPNGRERGAESDEVRIMIKVLGPKMSPEYCLEALDIMKWADVHKAIKIIKLHNLMAEDRQGSLRDQLRQCAEHLENNEWNLQDTAINL